MNRYWLFLQNVPDEALHATIDGTGIASGTPYSVEDLVGAVRQRKESEDARIEPLQDLKLQEYEALVRGHPETTREDEFVCVPAPDIGPATSRFFDKVMLVKRLREIRALHSFTRVYPSAEGDPSAARAPLCVNDPGWLPAIEVSGEGVFLRLDTTRLEPWETNREVLARARRINVNNSRRSQSLGAVPGREITSRFLLLHTLAHSLISQWALDCGYPAASLRERLYVSDSMAGLLIYTATSDSAGSLGGIVAQADPARLDNSLREALLRSSWCSSDPLCIEAIAQGVDSLNLAACHACVLLPEVSCEEMNSFLDRGLLVGTMEDPAMAYFREFVT